MARMSRTQYRDSGAAAHHREPTEHRENKRHSTDGPNQTSEPDTRLPERAIDRKVGEERVEFTVGPGCVQGSKPLVKLVSAKPPLSRGMPQPVGDLLPIGV